MNDFLSITAEWLEHGKNCALACVLESHGSVPGGAGTFMLADENGRAHGTVGGGALELFAEETAKNAISEKKSFLKDFTLNHGHAASLGMVCGGNATLLVMYLPASKAFASFFNNAFLAAQNSRPLHFVWALDKSANWQLALAVNGQFTNTISPFNINVLGSLDTTTVEKLTKTPQTQIELGGFNVYSTMLASLSRAVIFGGGHVAQSLVPILSMVGFACTVFDDREKFADKKLFPTAQNVVMGDFAHINKTITLNSTDYIIVVTRGHAADFEVEKLVLTHKAFPFPYVGVIGSRTKTAAVAQRLTEAGVPEERIQSVYAPIGLAIGAKTPAEIAVSIAAQMIEIRAGL